MHRHDAAYVTDLAARVLGDPEKAAHWLDRPSMQLGGRSPRELVATADTHVASRSRLRRSATMTVSSGFRDEGVRLRPT